jgi:hypothetical protein
LDWVYRVGTVGRSYVQGTGAKKENRTWEWKEEIMWRHRRPDGTHNLVFIFSGIRRESVAVDNICAGYVGSTTYIVQGMKNQGTWPAESPVLRRPLWRQDIYHRVEVPNRTSLRCVPHHNVHQRNQERSLVYTREGGSSMVIKVEAKGHVITS